jgi:hypothetical protein
MLDDGCGAFEVVGRLKQIGHFRQRRQIMGGLGEGDTA